MALDLNARVIIILRLDLFTRKSTIKKAILIVKSLLNLRAMMSLDL